jgi:hypothetical protein
MQIPDNDCGNADQPAAVMSQDAMESMIEQVVACAAEKIYEAQGRQGGLKVARAWVYQRPEQVREMGDLAPYYVGWIDPGKRRRSKSFGPGERAKRLAEEFREQVSAQLLTGTYNPKSRALWAEFRKEFEKLELPGKSKRTRQEILNSLNHFKCLRPTLYKPPPQLGALEENRK